MPVDAPSPTDRAIHESYLSRPVRILRLLAVLSRQDDGASGGNSVDTLPEDLMASNPSLTRSITDDDVALAQRIRSNLRGLCRPRTAAMWEHLAEVASSRNAWQPKALKALFIVIPLVVVATLIPYFMHQRGYNAWAKDTTHAGAEAAVIRSTATLLAQDAGSISAFPPGAYVHAQAALADLDAANRTLDSLWVLGNDIPTLHADYLAHPDAKAVATHDNPLRSLAKLKVHAARSELEIAHHVLGYAQEWANLVLPGALPSSLAGAWNTAAAAMNGALISGDSTSLQRASDRLTFLKQTGSQLAALQLNASDFSADDQKGIQPIIDALTAAIIADDRVSVAAELDRWQALKTARPLSYSLIVSSSPTDKHGVQRLAGQGAATPTSYLIVTALNAAGNPVTLPVYDTETHALAHASTFGVEVSPALFEAAKAQITTTHQGILVAEKATDQVIPHFTMQVLPGRITHW